MAEYSMQVEDLVRQVTGASSVARKQRVQSLWSGYGEIARYRVAGAVEGTTSVIVKHVTPPGGCHHPRGWNTDHSHRRKLRSYDVELAFYKRHARRCERGCRVAAFLGGLRTGEGWLLVLEDLDAAGYSGRGVDETDEERMSSCLAWLACFHATFLGESKHEGLWETGTYWHLATRPDEWAAMTESPLKSAAHALDRRLSSARFQTLVHGDAKVANFCIHDSGAVAAVDFQYVGGGCGMKDVAYFIGSCLSEDACEKHAAQLLDIYFDALREALMGCGKSQRMAEVENEWRQLYPLAWADFHRFLVGWSPGHWKLTGYSEAMVQSALVDLK